MLKWMMVFAGLGLAGALCLAGLGVGAGAMAKMLLVLGLMVGVAAMISWPFLRSERERDANPTRHSSADASSACSHRPEACERNVRAPMA